MSESMQSWYWENYEKSMDWINHHQVAFWKSQAMALKAENAYLKDAISKVERCQLVYGKRPNKNRLSRKRRQKCRKKLKNQQQQVVSAPTDFEVSPELIEFFRISIKHKQQRKKEKEEQEALCSFVPPQDAVDSRNKEMERLYGNGCSRIIDLEKSMTLNYDRFVDRKCPEYWPELPLNLNPA